jgi:hypothetical protein
MSRTLAELQELVDRYVAVAFPDDAVAEAMTPDEQRRCGDTYRGLAVRNNELIIDAGVHRGETLR